MVVSRLFLTYWMQSAGLARRASVSDRLRAICYPSAPVMPLGFACKLTPTTRPRSTAQVSRPVYRVCAKVAFSSQRRPVQVVVIEAVGVAAGAVAPWAVSVF